MKIGLDLDARVKLIQITWYDCLSLVKASTRPNKSHRKTHIEHKSRRGKLTNNNSQK
jgi:hypothetical protein